MSTTNTSPTTPPLIEHRLKRRKVTRSSVRLTVRKGALGLGKDISAGILNLTEDGIGFRSVVEMRRGDEVEITLSHISQNRTIRMMADICWSCALPAEPFEEPIYLVGARLRKRIAYVDLMAFC